MRVVAEALDELLDVLVHVRVVRDVEDPAVELILGGQFSVDQEIGDLEVGALLAELLDWDAAVPELAFVAVDPGDRAAAGSGGEEGRVVRHEAEIVLGDLDLAQLAGPDRAVGDLELVVLAGALVDDPEDVATLGCHAPG